MKFYYDSFKDFITLDIVNDTIQKVYWIEQMSGAVFYAARTAFGNT